MPTIAALILSLPDRANLLTEALASVHAQTRPPDDIVVGIDPYRLGEVANANRLIDASDSEWIAWLHDDDLWHPEHLATCEQFFDVGADVVVSRFDMVGRPWHTIEPWHTDFADLRATNWIGSPSMWVVRRSVFGRWCDPTPARRWVDWTNLNRLLDIGAQFVDTGVVTTTYRFGPWSNGSWKAG